MSKINDYLTEAKVFFLATVDGKQPKLRPLGAHLEMDGKVIFGVGDFKEVYKQMRESVCADYNNGSTSNNEITQSINKKEKSDSDTPFNYEYLVFIKINLWYF